LANVQFDCLVGLTVLLGVVNPTGAAPALTNQAQVLSIEGANFLVSRAGSIAWDPGYVGQSLNAGDRGRTGERTRLRLRLSSLSILTVDEFSEFLIEAGATPAEPSLFQLVKARLYMLGRDKPGIGRFKSKAANAATRGTEFTVEVEETTGRMVLSVLEGEAELSTAAGAIHLQSGEQGIAEPGQRPTKSSVLQAVNLIQWCLYYPAILNLEELSLSDDEQQALSESLSAYRAGDVLTALARYPAGRLPGSDDERVYWAALLLAAGQVEKAEVGLAAIPPAGDSGRAAQLAAALRKLIDSARFQTNSSTLNPALSTCLLAESYYQQSRANLDGALRAARAAVRLAPSFGFAQGRAAELEFSSGQIGRARAAIEHSLQLAPRNPQAHALKGFLLAAEDRIPEAIDSFEEAIAIDGGLGDAWLGRGLCRIRQGRSEEGREDLQVAAALEPQRAVLRSYLGKAFGNAGDAQRAADELVLAKTLDPGDPTAWLYSGLLNQQGNRINQAVRDLETSQDLNDNRRVYRSRLLLDQDRAVRGANLATVYRDAGMSDVGFREAARAVHDDYANYSAHYFLANSLQQLRDPRQINLRYDTAALSEYLVANLLAPIAASTLSPAVSAEEYSRLFERDRLGLFSRTEYLSSGEWLQAGAQYGILGPVGYSLESFYRSDPGQRPNNDQEQLTLSLQVKHELTLQDTLYFQTFYYNAEGGDLAQYYHQTDANPGLRVEEKQEPVVLAGYHHEWAPAVHTLLLGARLHDRLSVTNPTHLAPVVWTNTSQTITNVGLVPVQLDYESELVIYSAELQQIFGGNPCRVILGSRYQAGEFDTGDRTSPRLFLPASQTNVVSDFERINAYGYGQWQAVEPLLLIAGLSYDRLSFPQNFRSAPISGEEDADDQLSPKAGLIWSPGKSTVVRAAYARWLGGVSIDQAFQLEPAQVAGFIQSYRSIVPESAAGSVSAPRFETWGLALDQKFPTDTYMGVTAEWLKSEADRELGAFTITLQDIGGLTIPSAVPSGIRERLDYEEKNLLLTLNQLLGNEWSLGANYRLSHADLVDSFPMVPAGTPSFGGFAQRQHVDATLHQVRFGALYNHSSGYFAQIDSVWSAQSNDGYSPDIPGDDFWQFNLQAGYRLARRRVEIRVALLNITDRDYRLNPLNLTAELPRERTLAVSLKFNF
jgi:Flp pilus assembly protein TadD